MDASLDTGRLRTGLPARTGPAAMVPAEAGRRGHALVPAQAPVPGEGAASRGRRRRILIPALLVAGWGGLFAYCAAYLGEDLPFRPPSTADADRRPDEALRRVARLPDIAAPAVNPPAPEARHPVQAAPQVAAVPQVAAPVAIAAAPVAAPRAAALPSAEYVGVWGPTPAACGKPSRRRGYLPATISADRARAGRTICSFHDGRRTGNGWLMAAECSDRGRRWSSQVRLVVEGDRLTWTSNRGTAAYVRCGRRAG